MTTQPRRVIVVLGYSQPGETGLHPICAARLDHGALIATDRDVVVLSGWARVPGARPEAELMAGAWTGEARELVVDPDAQTTVGNATNALDDVTRTAADEVIVVTSRWHAPRAVTIFRWCLRRTGASVVAATPSDRGTVGNWIRELPRWAVMPLQLATGRPAPARARHS